MKKPFIVLGSSLAFLMFLFFPLNLNWNPKTLKGKYSKEKLKLNEETRIKHVLRKCSNFEKKIHQSQERQP